MIEDANPISDHKCSISHPFSDQNNKIATRFQTKLITFFYTKLSYIITRSPVVPLLAVTERYMNQKIEFISDFVHYVTRFQTAATEQRPDFRPKWFKNATRKGGTSPYSIIREYPSPGLTYQLIPRFSFAK